MRSYNVFEAGFSCRTQEVPMDAKLKKREKERVKGRKNIGDSHDS